MADQLFSVKAVAAELSVTTQAVWNWRTRYTDTPQASARVYDSADSEKYRPLWDMDALELWRVWHAHHIDAMSPKRFQAINARKAARQ